MNKLHCLFESFMTYFKRNTPIKPLVYCDVPGCADDESAIIVIAPRGYWAKNVALDVKTSKEALKYAAALLDLGDEYRYAAHKNSDGTFSIIGYLVEELIAFWPEVFDGNHDRQVVFAQWVFGEMKAPIILPSGSVLALCEGIVVEMNSQYITQSQTLPLENALSDVGTTFPLLRTSQLVPKRASSKTLWITLAILIVVLFNIMGRLGGVYTQRLELQHQREVLLEKTTLGQTSLERLAVISVLEEKQRKQKKFKEQAYTLKQIAIAGEVPRIATLPTAAPATAASSGIVLIPGSKPGEQNRLLVDGVTSVAPSTANLLGIKELMYDGKTFLISVVSDDPETLKGVFLKKYKNARTQIHGKTLEVRLK